MSTEPILTLKVSSVAELLDNVLRDVDAWSPVFPWFRGELADTPTPLTPKVFRPPRPGYHYDENNLLQTFRRRAHLLGLPIIPPRDAVDQWLFLARHVGLPTRLLDWTEGALIALYFAMLEEEGKDVVVWMLNPYVLNGKSASNALPNVFPLTWHTPPQCINVGFANIEAAWTDGPNELELPVAIEPTTIHPRMNAQHSYFTVHGKDRRPLCNQVGGECLRRYLIRIPDRDKALRDLRMLGVAHSTILPDAEALAQELSNFMIVPEAESGGAAHLSVRNHRDDRASKRDPGP